MLKKIGFFLILLKILFLINVVKCGFPDDCTTALPALDKYTNTKCLNIWYLYASTSKCDNCCMIRKIYDNGPAKIIVIDLIKKPFGKKVNIPIPWVRDPNKLQYTHIKGNSTVVGLDCDSYAVIRAKSELQLWVRNPNTTVGCILEMKLCNEKLFNYNPGKSCDGVKI
ncbi:uncharacterized protein [Onthophagus taurus]|uniref:uncharacterized protein n=1 Tax=Onthophagus taurus TaxID=166361 RepID=UPI0039BE08D2